MPAKQVSRSNWSPISCARNNPSRARPRPAAISLDEQLLSGIEGIETERGAALIRYKDDVLQAWERLLSSPSMVPYWVQNTGLEHASPLEAILPFLQMNAN
jgi:hypothetical protein